MSINKVILLGNAGRDADFREFDKGCVAQVAIATTKKGYKNKDGKDIPERTEWHNVVFFANSLAKVVRDYIKKGDKIYVEGELRTRKYTDKDGNEKQITEVIVEKLELLSPKKEQYEDLPE